MYFFFFFSSRRRHTRYIGYWSSDVCSSDLSSRARSLPGRARFSPLMIAAMRVSPLWGRDGPCSFGPRRHGTHIDRKPKPADYSTRVGDWLVRTLGCSALSCVDAQVARCGMGVRCGAMEV